MMRKNRWLGFLLALMLCVTLFPVAALADEGTELAEEEILLPEIAEAGEAEEPASDEEFTAEEPAGELTEEPVEEPAGEPSEEPAPAAEEYIEEAPASEAETIPAEEIPEEPSDAVTAEAGEPEEAAAPDETAEDGSAPEAETPVEEPLETVELPEEPIGQETENLPAEIDPAEELMDTEETEEPEKPEEPEEPEEPERREPISVDVPPRTVAGGDDGADADTLFARYVDSQMRGTPEGSSPFRLRSSGAGNGFTGTAKAVYDLVSAGVVDIAAGRRASTVFEITVEDLGLDGPIRWTAADLGLGSILDENWDTVDGFWDAFWNKCYQEFGFDRLYTAITDDHPYSFYWSDKTKGMRFGTGGLSIDGYENWVELDTVTVTFYVMPEYADGDDTTMNTTIGTTVTTAAQKARNIVAAYTGKSDREKLEGYRLEICRLVNYNDDAAEESYQGSISSSNPWQIIWVFDGDSSTNVVCEGYAKAFQHLCDLSSFYNDIRCISVTGDAGGGHMWNVVRMENGKSYVADVTWCDDDGDGSDWQFLVGADSGSFPSYTVNGGTYTYDDDTISLYGQSVLTLSAADYDEEASALYGWRQQNGSWYYYLGENTTAVGWRQINDDWFYFSASGVMQTGWQQVNGKWYYLGTNGKMATGWVQVGGNWYYLGASGVMQTGWQQVNGKWYYLGTNGKMATGWAQIGANWYYFNASGAMQTGWQQVNGKWYYLGTGGKMATGWVQVGSYWYYLNASGVMQTGWQQINGKWYYLGTNGKMATGWVQVDGNWYYFNASGAMQTGWLQYKNDWYYLNSRMVTGWLQINGNWYWFDNSGKMAAGTTRIINGKSYSFDASGRMIP